MSVASCPSREELSAYALGKLSEDVSAAVADHIDACSACQAALATLDDAEDNLVAQIRRPPIADEFMREPQCDEALARLKAMTAKSLAHGGILAQNGISAHNGASAGDTAGKSIAMSQLGDYQLFDRLGQGGMGAVYKALHIKLRREVAVKILPKQQFLHDDQAVARFEREMAAVGALNHPNIVQAFDAREIEGTRFLVMEFVDGLDLTELVRRLGPLPVADAAALVRQAAKGLQAAYDHRMVHRDIKPSNLMLSREGRVKILDLGLARFHQDEQMSSEEMTGVHQVMGTPDYMAPEQITDSHHVDIRADIYSLGCTLYKLLVGRPPFVGAQYKTIFDKHRAHANDAPPPLQQFRSDVPRALIVAVNRMMAKDPRDRYPTPGEVAADLEAFTAGCDLKGLLAKAMETATPAIMPEWYGASTPRYQASALTAPHSEEDAVWSRSPRAPKTGRKKRAGSKQTGDKPRRRRGRWVALTCLLLLLAGLGAAGAWWAGYLGDLSYLGLRLGQVARPRATLEGHTDAIWTVAFSPDNQTLASAGVDRVIKIWNAAEGRQALELPGHQGEVRSVAFSPYGSRLVSGDQNGVVKIWDITRHFENAVEIREHKDEVRTVAFSLPDGKTLATGGYDRTIRFWDPTTGSPQRRFDQESAVLCVAFSPDGATMASAGNDGTIELWKASSGEKIGSLKGHAAGVRWVDFSPDGKTLASAGADRTVRLWDVANRQEQRILEGHRGEVRCVVFSPDGTMLASGGEDNVVRLWDADSGRRKQDLVGHAGAVTSVAFSPDGRTLASASGDKTVRLWTVETRYRYVPPPDVHRPDYTTPPPKLLARAAPARPPLTAANFAMRNALTGHTGAVRSLLFSPDSSRLASAGAEGAIRVWDPAAGQTVRTIDGLASDVRSLSFSRKGDRIAAADGSDAVRIWSLAAPTAEPQQLKSDSPVRAVTFAPEGGSLASAGDGNRITLWDLQRGEPKRTFDGFDDGITSLVYSPDGNTLAAAGRQWVTFYYPDRAFRLGAFRSQTEDAPVIQISADGKTLAKTSRDATILLWNLQNDMEQATLVGHKRPVHSLAFSPDGGTLVSSGGDKGFRIWDPRTGKSLGTSTAYADEVLAIAFAPDGKTLATAGADGKIVLWDVR